MCEDTTKTLEPGRGECNFSRRRFITRSVIAAAGLTLAPLAAATPAMAGGLFPLPSVAQQKQVGDQAAKQIAGQYKEINDSRTREFRATAERLVSALPQSDQNTWDYRFHMLDSKEVNAFALPGGNIYLFSGLYDNLKSQDALAAVTGHEMTHVRKQHWAQAYAQQQERDTFLSIGLSIFHAGQATQTVAGLADQAIGLRFSRSEEDQADAGGLDDMTHAGYNPNGMLDLFAMLQKTSGNGDTLGSDFLSNHPLTTTRIQHTRERIAQLGSNQAFPAVTPL